MQNAIICAPRLGTPWSQGGDVLYWRDLDGAWTRHRDEARCMPLHVAEGLAAYLTFEGVPATVEQLPAE